MRVKPTCAAILTAFLLLTACNRPAAVDSNAEATATVSPTKVAATSAATKGTATTKPAATATAAATQAPTPEPAEIETSGDMATFMKNSNFVVKGKFVKFTEVFNSVRDDTDIKKEHPTAYIHHRLYEFKVEECLKGSIKKDATILVALETESKMNLPNSKEYKCERYVEPTLNETVVQALEAYDKDFKLYYTSSFNEPQRFSVLNDKLFVISNNEKIAETFELGKGKKGGEGISMTVLESAVKSSK